MRISGRRVHLAGSAGPDALATSVRYAHDLLTDTVTMLAKAGCLFAVMPGAEPVTKSLVPATFDWTAMQALMGLLALGTIEARAADGRRLILATTTDKTELQIPASRRRLWDELISIDAVEMRRQRPGTFFGSARREVLAEGSDILLALSGGAGVEHLADLYCGTGKAVIPLDLQLGSSSNDGRGGAATMAAAANHNHSTFFRLQDNQAAGSLLRGIRTQGGTRPTHEVARGIELLLRAIADPQIFYVRMLNPTAPGFRAVDGFFKRVVDPVVMALGYVPYQAGRELSEHAWMNVEIFDQIRNSAGAVVDLTGSRPNCYAELGYLLGLGRVVLIASRAGEPLAFDVQQLETHFWPTRGPIRHRQAAFRDYWYRVADRPRLPLWS